MRRESERRPHFSYRDYSPKDRFSGMRETNFRFDAYITNGLALNYISLAEVAVVAEFKKHIKDKYTVSSFLLNC